MIHELSILDPDLDETLHQGDLQIDPFNKLGVEKIEISRWTANGHVIDLNNLHKETENVNTFDWWHLISDKSNLLLEDKILDLYIRLAWFICREYINERSVHHIRYDKILIPAVDIERFIWRGSTDYAIFFEFIDAFGSDAEIQIIIRFKNDIVK